MGGRKGNRTVHGNGNRLFRNGMAADGIRALIMVTGIPLLWKYPLESLTVNVVGFLAFFGLQRFFRRENGKINGWAAGFAVCYAAAMVLGREMWTARTVSGLLSLKGFFRALFSGAAMAMRRSGRHLITTVIEHPAVLETMRFLEEQGFEVTYLPVDAEGQVSPQAVEAAVREDTILVSVMHTNNEIGTIQPIEEIGAAVKRRNPRTLFHVDAVQGFGKARILPKKARIDLLSVSGHKIHAAKGVGFLYIGDGCRIRPILFGGGQQKGMRSGTQNTAGIAGMALSARILYDSLDRDNEELCRLRDLFISLVTQIPDVFINGMGAARRAPHIISLTVPGVRAEVLLHALEDKGVYVSSGSACATNRPHLSGTLSAIGLKGEHLDNTIRISLSVMNTEADVREAAAAIAELVPFLRRYTRH